MSVYKYVTPEGAMRFLRTWAMRITPPDQFNDPFEMRPTLHLSASGLEAAAPALVRQDLAAQFAQTIASQSWAGNVGDVAQFSDTLVAFLLRQLSGESEERFLRSFEHPDGTNAFLAGLHVCREQFEPLYEKAMSNAQAALPLMAMAAQGYLHEALPRMIGVLCLSGSSRHALMWAHYTDSHKGALLEFDETAPCFNRRRHDEDAFGRLHRVWYSDSRPRLDERTETDAFIALALTKALDWAYEQELRMLWPLGSADQTLAPPGAAPIHLIDVPPPAVRSITVGCKADAAFVGQVLQGVADVARAAKIAVRAASIDAQSFSLNYRDLR